MNTMATAHYGRSEGVSVLVLRGHLRCPVARALQRFVDEVFLRQDDDTAVIDLREIALIDSTVLGLLVRIGRSTLERRGRRSVIVCREKNVLTTMRAVAFDTLFVLTGDYPLDREPELTEVPLAALLEDPSSRQNRAVGKIILDAHRALSTLSESNQHAFAEVIAELEAETASEREAQPVSGFRGPNWVSGAR